MEKWPRGLRVTKDFTRTIQRDICQINYEDSHQRDVRWVVLNKAESKAKEEMVIISPYEANELMEEFQASEKVALHLYVPRQNLAFDATDHLDLYAVPSSSPRQPISTDLKIELNLFAGQLYFSSYAEYVDVCNYLGLSWFAAEDGVQVRSDGFIEPAQGSVSAQQTCKFKESPVKFLNVLMSKIRRHGGGIEKTHLGKVLEGRILGKEDFEQSEIPPKRKAEDADIEDQPNTKVERAD